MNGKPPTPLADFTVDVRSKAEPLYERLELDVTIDHDLSMRVSDRSLLQEHQDGVEITTSSTGSLVDRDSDPPTTRPQLPRTIGCREPTRSRRPRRTRQHRSSTTSRTVYRPFPPHPDTYNRDAQSTPLPGTRSAQEPPF